MCEDETDTAERDYYFRLWSTQKRGRSIDQDFDEVLDSDRYANDEGWDLIRDEARDK